MFKADSLGFFDLSGMPPHIDSYNSMPVLGLIHLTSAPPWLTKTEDVLKAHREFVRVLKEEGYSEIILSSLALKKFVDSRCRNYQKIGVILGLQHAPFDVLEGDNLKKLFDAGIRIMALAYEGKSPFGGGCMEPKEYLTGEGVRLLLEYEKNNIIFDISHTELNTALGIMLDKKYLFPKLSIFASHSGRHYEYIHNRNMANNSIRKIVKLGGIVGIPTLTFILSKDNNTLGTFMNNIEHAINLAGEDAVCVGSDGVYKYYSVDELKIHHEVMLKNIKPEYEKEWRDRFPEHPLCTYNPYKMDIIATALHGFYSAKIVEKICGLNFLNFLLRNLPPE